MRRGVRRRVGPPQRCKVMEGLGLILMMALVLAPLALEENDVVVVVTVAGVGGPCIPRGSAVRRPCRQPRMWEEGE